MLEPNTGRYLGVLTAPMLLEALKIIQSDETLRFKDMGICSSIDAYFDRKSITLESYDTMRIRDLMSRWPEYSGRAFYPIPDTVFEDPYEAYHQCTTGMWNKDTEYGCLRWELLEFCIEALTGAKYI